MTENSQKDGNEHRIDRRTALKFAGLAGLTGIPGTALAGNHGGNGGRGRGGGNDDEGNDLDIERIEPERPPIWEEVDAAADPWAEGLWFVEFFERPTAGGGRGRRHANERRRFRSEADREAVEFEERLDFTTLWNGMSISADHADITVIRGLSSVKAVYPVALVEAVEPREASPDLDFALAMTGADQAHDLGFTGDGLSVAVIDTGIDYNHLDLGGDGDTEVVYEAKSEEDRRLQDEDDEEHPRISHGWDYVGDDFDPAVPDTLDPNPDPMDPHSHGTHVAGIVGADAHDADVGVTGVAPETTLGAYKVFGVIGFTTAEFIVAAMEDAYKDGMDIVNMSLGASLQWGQDYPTTAASNTLARAGVVVVNSAGNDAGFGMWSLSAPANAHDIISVSSADNSHLEALVFEVDQLADPVPYVDLDGAELPPTVGESAPLELPNLSEIENDEGEVIDIGYFGCEPEDFEDFTEGNVALIERGHCFFSEKYLNAVDAGASGVVIFNNIPGLFFGTILDAGVEGIWGAAISDLDGATLVDLLEEGEEVRLEFTDDEIVVPNPTGGLLSGFTSYGQDVELEFGPTITAPGGMITSTIPIELGEYGSSSGTSMSAPHVAGGVALLLEAEPELDPFEVRDKLQNTAEPELWSLAPVPGLVDHSFRQGAGMLRIDQTIEAEQQVTPGQIAVGELDSTEVTLTIENDADEDVEYSIGHTGTLGASVTTFAPVFLLPGGLISAPESVEVPSGESVDVDVTIHAPGFGLPNHQYGGYVEFTPIGEAGIPLRVPYVGYDGDYQELPQFGYFIWPLGELLQFIEQEPILSKTVIDEEGEANIEPVDDDLEFIVREGELPTVEAFFGHFPQRLEMYAVDQESGRRWPILRTRNFPRSPAPDFFFAFPWAGTTQAGRSRNARPVASGNYTIEVNVLRTLGDPDVDEHWDTWESPEFELDTARGGPPEAAQAKSSVGQHR